MKDAADAQAEQEMRPRTEKQVREENVLANRIAEIILKSRCFAKLNARGWEAKKDGFLAYMVDRFGPDYPHDVIRRVAEVEFEIGSEIIKLRDSRPCQSSLRELVQRC